ncbi:peptide-methionine (R)-S-oxide reductase [Sphingorhabdus lutea]|uniref:peptide-methionine (R)-S-oxide reductase n=1 Tax=Sphingorhabdus lutea TaxID=1913578 RepID=A0A1L3J8Z5_9SPHN|nr:peptide-methionine (R)-S-oxide reductase MsrB [Sphingorhabdus lutea]APG61595.1 peptide-methionine (R)-S-oxide reductase [Sphingorhabdus lutea]
MNAWNKIVEIAQGENLTPPRRVQKSDAEWRELLSEEAYFVTRQHGTERPFSDGMCSLFEPGIYACICCDTHLFDSQSKFESGTGWPSFGDPIAENVVSYHGDFSHGMQRIEARCNVCDAHLGHVFPDGPPPSGLRYCINAVSLRKISG